jgi:hypothetical protein
MWPLAVALACLIADSAAVHAKIDRQPRVAVWVAVHGGPPQFTEVRACGLIWGVNAYEPW